MDTAAAADGEYVGLCLYRGYCVREAAVPDARELGLVGVLLAVLGL